jgi:hypothetical protein
MHWGAYDEPASSAIVRSLLAGDADALHKEEQIKSEFCRLLRKEQPLFPGDLSPIPGAIEFLNDCIWRGCQSQSPQVALILKPIQVGMLRHCYRCVSACDIE